MEEELMGQPAASRLFARDELRAGFDVAAAAVYDRRRDCVASWEIRSGGHGRRYELVARHHWLIAIEHLRFFQSSGR